MITLLVGENDYELTQKITQLKAEFNGVAERYDAADLSTEQLADIFAGQSLFAMTRLIFLDAPSENAELWKQFDQWAKRLSDDTQLVLIEPKPDKRTSTYKWLKKHANVQEVTPPDSRASRIGLRCTPTSRTSSLVLNNCSD